jgi:hypothetical protein
MDKKTMMDTLVSNAKKIDFSVAREYAKEIQASIENNSYECELKSFIERYKHRNHKNIPPASLDEKADKFLSSLGYLCFVPLEIINRNEYLSKIIYDYKLSHLFIPLDNIQQQMEKSHKIGSYIIYLPMLAIEVITVMTWNFTNELMTALKLNKARSINQHTINGKTKIDIVFKPLSSIQKSWNDNLRQIKKKHAKGECINGQTQQGWLRVSDLAKHKADELKLKDFNLENSISELGKVSQGLIPNSVKHLDIFFVGKPSRSDTRLLYDQLRCFYDQINPLNNHFESLDKRLQGQSNDEKIKAKETSDYYEFLGRKMRRYFGIEFIELT